jgi:hypothetical protein
MLNEQRQARYCKGWMIFLFRQKLCTAANQAAYSKPGAIHAPSQASLGN